MDIRCEGCGATPTPEQKQCKYCGTEFDYSQLEMAEEMMVETNETDDSVGSVDETIKDLQAEQKGDDEADSKVVSIRESGQYTEEPESEKGLLKKLFRKK